MVDEQRLCELALTMTASQLVRMMLDVPRVFLNTAPEDRSGEDRTLVVVDVSAENLGGNVPAGTVQPAEAICHIDGVGSVEAATAEKHACNNILINKPRSRAEARLL